MNLREIDRLVAEKVMGWIPQREIQDRILYVLQDGTHVALGWNPTVNISDAWQVVEKLRETSVFSLHDAWDEGDNKIFCADFEYNDGYHVVNHYEYAKSAPLAICLAALKSVGVSIELEAAE